MFVMSILVVIGGGGFGDEVLFVYLFSHLFVRLLPSMDVGGP